MAKRARCPHCDRLFGRDELDRHILRCRERNRAGSHSISENMKKTVIVDGNNIAYHLSPDGKPYVNNLLLAQRSLVNRGYRPIFVISAALVHSIDKPDTLQTLMNDLEVVRAPRGTNDDLKIIQIAQKRNADIISNDRFLDWLDRYPWVTDRLRKFRMTPSGLLLT
ncbi:hypothetical protein EU528_10990 [Candidatus Thorarchaeota archaeon]|nr:MAG: hypothetical protein EU528_10990 [Candidatus Thorarchaeota archaeon]